MKKERKGNEKHSTDLTEGIMKDVKAERKGHGDK